MDGRFQHPTLPHCDTADAEDLSLQPSPGTSNQVIYAFQGDRLLLMRRTVASAESSRQAFSVSIS